MITKEELLANGLKPYYDEREIMWTIDFDYVMYNIKEQTLYHFDEVYGKHIKLCKVTNIDDLIQLIWEYFKIDVNDNWE